MRLRAHWLCLGFVVFACVALLMRGDDLAAKASALYREKKFSEAALLLEAHVERNPKDLNSRLLLGLCYQQAEDRRRAEAVFEAAVHADPLHGRARYFLARVRFLLGNFVRAEQEALAAMKLGEPAERIHILMGMIRAEQGRYEDALVFFRKAMESSPPGAADPWIQAGIVLLRTARPAEAVEILRTAVQRKADSVEAMYHLARAHLELRQPDLAIEMLTRAASLGHEPSRRLLRQARAGGLSARNRVQPATGITPIRFQEVAASAGLDFVLQNSPTAGKHIVETMLGGLAAFDYDNDGLTDLYFTNGASLPGLRKDSRRYWNRLYRNLGDMRFTDVTAAARVAGEGYSMGVAAGDYNNDGNVDLFVAGVRANILFRNRGDGTFENVTLPSGINSREWSVGAAWLDYDRDGLLDLFVVNYLVWLPDKEPYCGDRSKNFRVYCPPEQYEGTPNRLYRNLGNGAFEDVSDRAGISKHIGKGMSAAVADMDTDGWPDIFVANDRVGHFLFRNRGDGSFQEVALTAGVALLDDGSVVSGMGSDFRDYDGDTLPDIVITTLAGETFPLFVNQGRGYFRDQTAASRLAVLSHRRSGWGIGIVDLNNDGRKDLFTANSHVTDNIEVFSTHRYKLPNSVFAARGDGTFLEDSSSFTVTAAHRGAAFADFNYDGKIDVAVSAIGSRAELWENVTPGAGNWVIVTLEGTKSNRDGMGASICVAGQCNQLSSSVGYASSSLAGVHFGLGSVDRVAEMRITWPGGAVQVIGDVSPNRILRLREPTAYGTK